MDRRLTVLILAPLLLGWHWFDPAARRNNAGMRAYQEGRFGEALQKFLSARGLRPDDPALQHNTAAAMYRLGKFREALEEFSRVSAKHRGLSAARLHYNLGNTFYRLGQWGQALEQFKQALLANPRDQDTKRNFELTLKKLQQETRKKKSPRPQSRREQNQSRREPGQPPPGKGRARHAQTPQQKFQALLQYLSQKEREQIKKRRSRAAAEVRREKDW